MDLIAQLKAAMNHPDCPDWMSAVLQGLIDSHGGGAQADSDSGGHGDGPIPPGG